MDDLRERNRKTLIGLIHKFEVSPRHGKHIALHEACRYGFYDEVVRLLGEGVDVNSRTEDGGTALMVVYDNVEILKLLLEHGADVNVKDNKGITPLIYFCYARKFKEKNAIKIINMFLDAGADKTVVDDSGKTAYMLAKQRYCEKVYKLLEP